MLVSEIWLAASSVPSWTFAVPVLVLALVSRWAERSAPYEPAWNDARSDSRRDLVHAVVNEGTLVASLLLVGSIGLSDHAPWPTSLPVALQMLIAVLVLDLGITLAHVASHRNPLLWRVHAVHHSVSRCYSLNGLMKHPLHQMVEATAGVAPLLAVGVPSRVLSAATALVAAQLLLQHSNVEMRLGRAGTWLALAPGHRQHHLSEPGAGDVNFGLFFLVWDRMLGTYSPPDARRVRDGQIGIAGRPDYPSGYRAQLVEPFRVHRAAAHVP